MKRGKRFSVKVFPLLMLAMIVSILAPGAVKAADEPWMTDHDIPAYQKKNMYETETTEIKGITVVDKAGKKITDPVHFVIFNSTKQEIQEEVDSKDGVLPTLKLINDHNYTIYAQDKDYIFARDDQDEKNNLYNNVYVWVNDGKIKNIKDIVNQALPSYPYGEVTSLTMQKRDEPNATPEEDRRIRVDLTTKVKSSGGTLSNVNVIFTSDVETVTAKSGNSNGRLSVNLLEDVNYMVSVDNANWDIDPFPLAVKDKSEYNAGRYPYDHTSCNRVGGADVADWDILWLVNKGQTHKEDTTLTNTNYGDYKVYADIAGKTTITGANFKDCLVLDHELDKSLVKDLDASADYDVIDIKVVNPHRWEFCKFAAGDYTITEGVAEDKNVKQVSYLKDGKRVKIDDFQQSGSEITFKMDSLSLYPIVVEYGEESEPEPEVDLQKMTVKVVDEEGNPVEGVKLYLKGETYPENFEFAEVTDKSGKAEYICSGEELTDDNYQLMPTEDSGYITESPVEIWFDYYDDSTCILGVGGDEYKGQEVELTVKSTATEPEFDPQKMTVKVEDKEGNPVEGVKLYLKGDMYPVDFEFAKVTDKSGKTEYICSGEELTDDTYYIMPTEDSGYTTESPVQVWFDYYNAADSTYVMAIDTVEYTGQEIVLRVESTSTEPEPEPEPEFDPKKMTIKVVDEKGSPVEGLELYLKSEGYGEYGNLKPGVKTDASGKLTYECGGTEMDDDEYSLLPVEGSEYTCDSPCVITFGVDENWDTYIATIDGEEYAGQEVTLTVKSTTTEPEPEPEPEFDPKKMTIKVVDEDGKAVEGLELYLKSRDYPGNGDLKPGVKTDASGKLTYECDNNEFSDDEYSLLPAEGNEYTCDSPRVITFGMDENWDTYIATIDGEEYAGQEVTLTVKSTTTEPEPEPEPEITNTKASVDAVGMDGGKAKVTVSGTALPETLYYSISYVTDESRGIVTVVEGQEVKAQGTDTERSFEVTLPSASDYPDATAWQIGVAVKKDGEYKLGDSVKVDETILTAKTEKALEDAIAEAGGLDSADYTKETWDAYAKAVEEARSLTEKEDATETEYQEALDKIAELKAALAPQKEDPEDPKPEDPDQETPVDPDKGQGTQNPDGSQQGQQTTDGTQAVDETQTAGAAQTSDTAPILPIAGIMVLSLAVIAGVRIRTRIR